MRTHLRYYGDDLLLLDLQGRPLESPTSFTSLLSGRADISLAKPALNYSGDAQRAVLTSVGRNRACSSLNGIGHDNPRIGLSRPQDLHAIGTHNCCGEPEDCGCAKH